MATIYNRPTNIGTMIGFTSKRIMVNAMRFNMRSLTQLHDEEVQDLKNELIRYCANTVLKLGRSKPSGMVLHSGSEANEVALYYATRSKSSKVILCSTNCHSSIINAAKKLGCTVIALHPDKSYSVSAEAMKKVIVKYKTNIACIIAVYGTTDLGIKEEFITHRDIIELAKKYGIAIHIDAAWGGFNLALKTLDIAWKNAFKSAATVTIDPHKFIGVIGCGVLLSSHINYIKDLESEYFSSIGTFWGTTRSAFPTAVAVQILRGMSPAIFRRLKRSYVQAEIIKKTLETNNIPLIYDSKSPNIPIYTVDERHADRILYLAKNDGFILYKVRVLHERSSINYGVRICITSQNFTKETLKKVNKLIPIWYYSALL